MIARIVFCHERKTGMYLLYLTLKTPNALFALGILLYALILAFLCPLLKKKEKKLLTVILCLLPAHAALAHYVFYGNVEFGRFRFLYLESLLPLIFLLPGRSRKASAAKSVLAVVSVFAVCAVFLVASINKLTHNFTRDSFTESFTKTLDTLEREYCLNSWKKIDYDAMRKEYYPRVEEAEKNNDEGAYNAVITEIVYRHYDSHVSVYSTNEADNRDLFGNDYGLSMIELEDGSVIAVFVEPSPDEELRICDGGSRLNALGIHDGTQILAWDGQEIHEALEQVECIYPLFQFPVKSNEDRMRPIFLASKGGESVKVTFLDDDGKEQTAELPMIGEDSQRIEFASLLYLGWLHEQRQNDAHMLNDKCGYLQVIAEEYDDLKEKLAVLRHGYFPELTDYYAELIEGLKQQGMEYLIIDIRGNGGGTDCCAGALASLFTDEKRYLVGFGYEDGTGYHTTEDMYLFPDGRNKDLPVAVLVNSLCMSAGDALAKYLGDCDNVTLMGLAASSGVNQNTGGRIHVTKNICISYPTQLSLSEDHIPFIDTDDTRENRIPLDVTIPMTKETALTIFNYKNALLHEIGELETLPDPELDYAMNYLEKNSQ